MRERKENNIFFIHSISLQDYFFSSKNSLQLLNLLKLSKKGYFNSSRMKERKREKERKKNNIFFIHFIPFQDYFSSPRNSFQLLNL